MKKIAIGISSATLLALMLAVPAGPSLALGTAEQRAACTPDAFRLCGAEIPNVPKIIACMKRKKAELSPACRAVFHPDQAAN